VLDLPATAMFRGDAARTGRYQVSWAATPSHRTWRYQTGAWIKSSPVIVDHTVYVCALNGTVHAVDVLCGARRWACPTGSGTDSSPAVAGGDIYVSCGGGGGWVHALDAATGRGRWSVRTGGQDASSPAVADGLVIVGGPHWTLLALDTGTGELRWNYRTDAYAILGKPDQRSMLTSPAVVDGIVYVTGGGRLHALEIARGHLRWAADAAHVSLPINSPAVCDGVVYLAGGAGVCAFDAGDGKVRWRTNLDWVLFFGWGTVAVSGGTVLATGQRFGAHGRGGVLVALHAATGAMRWHYLTESAIEASPAVADGVVYIATRGNSQNSARLTALDVTSGTLRWWRWLPSNAYGEVVSSPAVAGGRVYLGLPNGELLAVPADGEPERSSLLGRIGAWSRRSERAKLAGLLHSGPLADADDGPGT
jgi:outer membrane protein assembly factor BamB